MLVCMGVRKVRPFFMPVREESYSGSAGEYPVNMPVRKQAGWCLTSKKVSPQEPADA